MSDFPATESSMNIRPRPIDLKVEFWAQSQNRKSCESHPVDHLGVVSCCARAVRLSEKEKRELKRHGKISEIVREAIRLYLRSKTSRRIVARLKELQKSTAVRAKIQDDLRLIRADRER